ncbi:PFL-like glycyl radical enzyme [Anaeromyces robustus]|uniref:PFL-like glycyl radical enzyme n=1 Tax=Anaeromyces robustus TaxID=1754192 RepID=A0A1Y1WQ87_9FUNG|nr:PFL-like glycyl radical enzyme [Anaeromyces robustus]|eukprot:ORX75690.1 PFL-like glycyl radical enzyme [Anaeromyces robustus]
MLTQLDCNGDEITKTETSVPIHNVKLNVNKIKETKKVEPETKTIRLNVPLGLDRDFIELLNNDPKGELDSATWKKLLSLEGLGLNFLDVARNFHDVINYGSDHSIDPNANCSIGKYKFHSKEIHEVLAPHQKLINVSQFFSHVKRLYGAEETKDLFRAWIYGDNYLHDSCYLFVPYCYAMSVEPIVRNGITFNAQLRSLPPKHARSFIGQVAETVTSMSQELAGAIAIADIFVYYAYFLQKRGIETLEGNEKESLEVENDFQNLVHILNSSHRFSGQSAFTNVSIFDMPSLEHLFGELYFPDGSQPNLNLVMEVQKIFCNWFARGQLKDSLLPYPFPVVTLNLKVNDHKEVIDQETFKYFCEININGLFNFFVSDSNKLASCCRVINNLNVHMSVFGEGGVNIGSLRIVTINLARIGNAVAKEKGDLDSFYEKLNVQLDKAHRMLLAHREFIKLQIQRGACPYFSDDLGFMFLERFFLTFGINGLYEGLMEMGYNMLEEDGLELSRQILKYISDYANSKCDIKEKILFNVEQVPGESLAIKHALKDKIVCGMDYSIYANQFVPLWSDINLEKRVKIDGDLTKYMSGGCITHINLVDRIGSVQQMEQVVRFAIKNHCEHFAINYSYNRCENEHITISGNTDVCPICSGRVVDHITRVVGYFTSVSAWSPGRRAEFKTRKFTKY